jgi:hypothetical protein
MDIQGAILWGFRSIGDVCQLVTPFLILAIALLWYRSGDRSGCYYLAAIGAILGLVGRASQWLLPSVSWIAYGKAEMVPTGNTSLIEALAYLTFFYIGQGFFLVAVLLHFLKQASRRGKSSDTQQ